MTDTYVPLANVTLSSTVTSVTFSSIPNTYRDLILIYDFTLGATGVGVDSLLELNGSNTASYPRVWMSSSGTTTSSGTNTDRTGIYLGFGNANNRHIGILQILDYSATDKHKPILSQINFNLTDGVEVNAFRFASNSAVTSMKVKGNNYIAGSNFALYGIVS